MNAQPLRPGQWSLDKKTTAVFTFSLALLVAIGVFSHAEFAGFEQSSQWVAHTQEVIGEIRNIQSDLVDAETGQRGYLLTGEDLYLEPYRTAVQTIPTEVDRLRRLTADNPRQQQRLHTLESLVANKLAELKKTIDLRNTESAAAALKVVRTGEGQRYMDDMRAVLREMEEEEEVLLTRRSEQSEKDSRSTALALSLSALLAFGLIALAMLVINRNIFRRRRAEEAMQMAHAELEQRVRDRTAELRRRVAEQQLTQEVLRAGEERYRSIVETTPDGIWVVDSENQTTFVNKRMAQLLGYTFEEMMGRTWLLFLEEPARAAAAGHLERRRRGVEEQIDLKFRRKDGSDLWTIVSSTPLFNSNGQSTGALLVVTDITQRRRLEEQFRQAQKMEAVGQLAGGVAHDFNNLLTVILGFSDLLFLKFPPKDPSRDLLQEIKKAGERAATLTRQLLAFSRKQVLQPEVLDLNVLLADIAQMLRRLVGADINLITTQDPALHPVKADKGQLEQTLMNLAVNARDAMPKGGKLTLETRNVELDATYTRTHPEVHPGSYVLLAVSDTGHGMTPEVKARIFEPFFTTKGVGQGTGLGLATVFGIVKQSGGSIEVYSEPGHGTSFKVYLPSAKEAVASLQQVTAVASLPKGSETILLVEDEEGVRGLVRQYLQMEGYTVLEAPQGDEALSISQRHHGTIHLLVTDVVMPGMSGPDLAARLAASRPGIKVLYLSGYTNGMVAHKGVEEGMAFLGKPFTPEELARKVRETLDK